MGKVGQKEMMVAQLFKFMMVVEKRHEREAAAIIEKLGVIQISQREMAGSWRPKVDQALGELTGAIESLKVRVDQMDTQNTTAVLRSGQR